jgi:hypothetical protein
LSARPPLGSTAAEALDALGEVAVCVDLMQGRIRWSTSSWRDRYERMTTAELKQRLQPALAACAASAGMAQRVRLPASASVGAPETWAQLALLAPPAVVVVRILGDPSESADLNA